MDRRGWPLVFELGLLCPHLADRPRGARKSVVLRVLRDFMCCFVSIRSIGRFWLEVVGRTVHPVRSDCPRGADCPRWACGLSEFRRVHTRGSGSIFGLSARDPRTIHPAHVDRPPDHLGLSTWDFADCLSLLLLVLCFRVALSWGLFLGLVGPLWLCDLGKLVWESLVVDLGHSTTRNYLICGAFSTTFSENITKSTTSTTYSFFRHKYALKPITLRRFVKLIVILRRIPVFRHRCALMDINSRNIATIC
jgi:hypothetical protein